MSEQRTPAHEATPLAIVGIGALFPSASDHNEFWQLVQEGRDAISDLPETHWNAADYVDPSPKARDMVTSGKGGFLSPVEFDPLEFGIAPKDIESTDSSQLLALVAAKRALADAGYGDDAKQIDRDRTSVILGVTGALQLVVPLGARLGHPLWRRALEDAGVTRDVADDVVERIRSGYVEWSENSFPGLLGNVVAGRVANRLDLHGTNCVVDAACASSLSAIHLAAMELESGRADVAVTGGVDTFSDVFMYTCFSQTTALSPTGSAKPFDAAGDGTILGEGVGIVVLKRLADAERDGDRVYAVVRGVGTSSDGKGNAIYAPSSEGQQRAMRRAYASADIDPATVELVEAHGTGTRVGDAVEASSLEAVYRESGRDGRWAALGSVKSQIGHTKAAAGVAGLIKSALSLYEKVLPPTIRVEQPVEPLAGTDSPLYLNAVKRPWIARAEHPRRAALSAFGFGGSNYHAVLEEHAPEKPHVDWNPDVEVLPFGAETVEELRSELSAFPADLEWDALARRAAVARDAFRTSATCRVVLVTEHGRSDLARQIEGALAMLDRDPDATAWSSPDGAYYGRGNALGSLAVLFPGQGAQYVGMLRDLACRFPAMQLALQTADRAFESAPGRALLGSVEAGLHLSDRIFPYPAFQDALRERAEKLLRDTRVAQPAIGAVSLGALAVLATIFGVAPSAFAGHSYGELAALSAAGGYDLETLERLSILRGDAMVQGGGTDSDADCGSMLAIRTDRERAAQLLADAGLDLVVANHNSPSQVVLSGATAEIERAAELCRSLGLRATKLEVSAAFHSALVADASETLRAALDDVEFRARSSVVYANTTAAPYPDDADAARDLLANQLASPVEFAAMIAAMHHDGVRTFLEVGPGARLTGLVRAVLDGREHRAFAIDASSGRRSGMADLAAALAQLAAAGHDVALQNWNEGVATPEPPAPARRRMTVSITGANYRAPKPELPARTAPATLSTAIPAAPAIPTSTSTPIATPTPRTPTRPEVTMTPTNHSPAGAAAPQPPVPPPRPISRPISDDASQAMQLAREQMAALLRMQEQTADLHRRFLDQQESAQRALEELLRQQQSLLGLAPLPATPPASAPVAAPVGVPDPIPVPIAVPAPAPAPVAAPAAASTGPDLTPELLAVVAEKTGYPADLLDLSMELDADLGIDSIKRVEILSAMQERVPGLPAVASDELGALRTLGDVAAKLGSSAAVSAPSAARPAETAAVAAAPVANEGAADILLGVVAEKTGYPADLLDLAMELDADLGIDSIKRVEILSAVQEQMPGAPVAAPDDLGRFRTLGDVVAFLAGTEVSAASVGPADPGTDAPDPTPPGTDTDAPVERRVLASYDLNGAPQEPVEVAGEAPIWVAGDADGVGGALVAVLTERGRGATLIDAAPDARPAAPDALAGLVICAPGSGADDAFLRDALGLLKHAGPALRAGAQAGGALLATVSRLDGSFGLVALNGASPETGGLAGYAKTAAHEWPDVACKALDLPADVDDVRAAAERVADELFVAGPLEVGLSGDARIGLKLVDTPFTNGAGGRDTLDEGALVVVTGGARGVTADAAVAIAEAFRPTLLLLGRRELPETEPDWLSGLTAESDIKRALIEQGKSPRAVQDAYRGIAAAREIRSNLRRMEQAGARVVYRPTDVRDAAAVADAVDELRAGAGPVRGVVHGAGVLRDSLIEEKTGEQFDAVYGTKVEGLRAVLGACGDDDLRWIVLFSSSTGRFGRAGQVDYAAANEVLNKVAQQQAAQRPNCRVVSVNWGPWDGGMVTDAHKRVFASEGVALIGRRAGGEYLIRELTTGSRDAVEVVVLGPGSGPLDAPAPRVAPSPDLELVFERTVDAATHPVLASHVVGGRPVVPVVLTLEWLAHGALHGNPGLRFHGVDDLRVMQALTLESGPATIRVRGGAATRDGDAWRVPMELRSADGDSERLHARATIVLVESRPEGGSGDANGIDGDYPRAMTDVYDELLFHGEAFHGLRSVDAFGEPGIVATASRAPAPREWMDAPPRGTWLADPLALDAAFQAMVLWTREHLGAPSLPTELGRYRQFASRFPSAGVTVVARVTKSSPHAATADIDFLGPDGTRVARLDGYACVVDASLEAAYRRA